MPAPKKSGKGQKRKRVSSTRKPKSGRRPRVRHVRNLPMNLWPTAMLDPTMNRGRPLPVPGLIGHFTCVDSSTNGQYITNSTTHGVLVLQWTTSEIRFMTLNDSPTSGGVSMHLHGLQTMQLAAPSHVRPMRLSLTLRNVTKADDVAGSIRVLMLDDSIEWAFSADGGSTTWANYNTLASLVENDSRAKTYSNNELRNGHRWCLAPSSTEGMSNAKKFLPYVHTDTISPNVNHVESIIQGAAGRGLQTMLVLVPGSPSSAHQVYDWNVHDQTACYFPANTLGSTMARAPQMAGPGNWEAMNAAIGAVNRHVNAPMFAVRTASPYTVTAQNRAAVAFRGQPSTAGGPPPITSGTAPQG
jgi:hypothetical protein